MCFVLHNENVIVSSSLSEELDIINDGNFPREGGIPEVCLCDIHVCLFHLFNFIRRHLCLSMIMIVIRTFLLRGTDGEQNDL